MSSPQNPYPQGPPPSGTGGNGGDSPWNQPTVAGPPAGGPGWDPNAAGPGPYGSGPSAPGGSGPGTPNYDAAPPFSNSAPPFSQAGSGPGSGQGPYGAPAPGYGTPPPPGAPVAPGVAGGPGYGAPPPPKQKSNTALFVVCGVIGLVVLLCLGGFFLIRSGDKDDTTTDTTTAVTGPGGTTPTSGAVTPTTAASGSPGGTLGATKTGADPQTLNVNAAGDFPITVKKPGLILIEAAGYAPFTLLKIVDTTSNSPIWSKGLDESPKFAGVQYIEKPGSYKLSVSGAKVTPFKVVYSDLPETGGPKAPVKASGSAGKSVLGPVQLQGPIKLTANHAGSGNFVVHVINTTKDDESLIYNEIGTVKGLEKPGKPSGGSWYFTVEANGPWDLSVAPG